MQIKVKQKEKIQCFKLIITGVFSIVPSKYYNKACLQVYPIYSFLGQKYG